MNAEMNIKMLPVEIWTVTQVEDGNLAILRSPENDMTLNMYIGRPEAQALLFGIEDIKSPRPLTHDLMLSLITGQGLSLGRIEIHDYKDSVYYARLILEDALGKEILRVDCRPSDALCLASRAKCPVLVNAGLIRLFGVPAEQFFDLFQDLSAIAGAPQAAAPSPPKDSLARLHEKLGKAVEKEDYEKAADLRDRIRALGDSLDNGADAN